MKEVSPAVISCAFIFLCLELETTPFSVQIFKNFLLHGWLNWMKLFWKSKGECNLLNILGMR